MEKTITIGQSLKAIMGALIKATANNGGKVSVNQSNVIAIKRGRFNPAEFIGKNSSINANEMDTRSTTLTELDITKVKLVTMLRCGETYINSADRLKRLKKKPGKIRLNADIFLTLWENQHLIPESWKEKVNGKTHHIFFDGSSLKHSGLDRFHGFLCLYWNGSKWDHGVDWQVSGWTGISSSAILAS